MNLNVSVTRSRSAAGWIVSINGTVAGRVREEPLFAVLRRTRTGWALVHTCANEGRAYAFRSSYRKADTEKVHVVPVVLFSA